MANALTVQLRPTKHYSPPDIKNLFHNTGLSKATYWLKEADNIISDIDIKNLTTRKAVDLWRSWKQEAIDLVFKNKGKLPQSKQVLIEEGLLVVGKNVVVSKEGLIKIFEEFKKWFETKYNTKILGYFYHDHEGHISENEEFIENLHIHFFFLNVDKYGNSVRRQIKRTDLSEFQTKIYEIGKKYIPDLKRATNYAELGLKAPKHQSHREYRIKKIKETIPKLTKKTKDLEKENENLKNELAKVKDLKEENKKLRALLKELGAERSDYAYLEQFIKDLKERIKNKEVTIQQMQEELEQVKQQLEKEIQERQKFEMKNIDLEEDLYELKEENKTLKQLAYSDIICKDTNKPFTYKTLYNNQVFRNEKLEAELERLKKEKEELEQELFEKKKREEELEQLLKRKKQEEEFIFSVVTMFKIELTYNDKFKLKNNYTSVLQTLQKSKKIKKFEILKDEKNEVKAVKILTPRSKIIDKFNKVEISFLNLKDSFKAEDIMRREINKVLDFIQATRDWNLSKVNVSGSELFVKITKEEIAKRISIISGGNPKIGF